MRHSVLAFGLLLLALPALGQFAPGAGEPGTTAIKADSSAVVNWASGCTVVRGLRCLAVPDSGYASAGADSNAVGPALARGVVSLGDGGHAVLTFPFPIADGPGPDFAVFENGFENRFLELAFVEVSTDSLHWQRFSATSLTPESPQVGPFDYLDPVQIDGLAGKYRWGYGTPFDLADLPADSLLDPNRVRFVRVVDAVGCVQEPFGTTDGQGRWVNDPWPTNFPSGGFDLDGVAVLHQQNPGGIPPNTGSLSVFPNPASSFIVLPEGRWKVVYWFNQLGQTIGIQHLESIQVILQTHALPGGLLHGVVEDAGGKHLSFTFVHQP